MRDSLVSGASGSRGATDAASLRVWDAPALRMGRHLQEGLAEPGLLWRPLIKTMAPSQESVTWPEQRHFQPPELLPKSPLGTAGFHWASRAAAQPFCFEITCSEIKEARDSSDSGLLPVSLKNV